MKQLDLDGYQVPYKCKKCSRCFSTMKESSKHQSKHKKRLKIITTVNMALENYHLVSTKRVIIIEK